MPRDRYLSEHGPEGFPGYFCSISAGVAVSVPSYLVRLEMVRYEKKLEVGL